MTQNILAFGWYGGKFRHLDWLLPLLPKTHTFVDAFGGSGVVILNRKPSPVEVYNDIDESLVTFFKILREQPDELIRLLKLSPYARRDYEQSLGELGNLPDLERARRFYIRVAQVYGGLGQTATPGRWAYSVNLSRRGMANTVASWTGKMDSLMQVADRFMQVQIECKPAVDIIRRYDSEDTLFYCDPTYPMQARSGGRAYGYEMTDADHGKLASALRPCKGAVVLSSYVCKLTNDLYADWQTIDGEPQIPASARHETAYKETRIETVWLNDRAVELNGTSKQLALF